MAVLTSVAILYSDNDADHPDVFIRIIPFIVGIVILDLITLLLNFGECELLRREAEKL